jgi:integrase/recombinase XerD
MAKHTRKKPQSVDDRLLWLAPHVDDFKTWLYDRGYRAVTIIEIVRLLACWAEWVRNAGCDIDSIESGFIASAEVFRGGKAARAP